MTDALALALLALLAGLFLSPWLVYPFVIQLVPRRSGRPDVPSSGSPPVSVLVPAHNEAAVLRAKLENTFALEYAPDRIRVLVCDDGSEDGTSAVAEGFADPRVTVLRNEERLGKAATLNRLLEAAPTELCLMTDAGARLSPSSLRKLVRALDDREFGVACARYEVREGHTAGAEAELRYWSFESWIRRREAERDLLVGASGAAWLVRRSLVPPLPADAINDDWLLPLAVRAAGHRVAYVASAVAAEEPTSDLRTMYRRWVRIAYGNVQMLGWNLRLFFTGGRLVLPLLRKLLRTLGPVFLLAAAALLAGLAATRPAWRVPAALVLGPGVVAALISLVPDRGLGRSRPVRLCRVVVLSQLAYLVGIVRALLGRKDGLWRRPPPPRDFGRPPPIPPSVRATKRALDVTASLLAFALLWPLMAALAIAIKATSRGPVFYRQARVRPDGSGRPVTFQMVKFRSMVEDAETSSGPVWAKRNDPRVTAIGAFMRRHRLDELPQFWNILAGDMSLVGPRPERPLIVEQLGELVPGYGDRHVVQKPGLTGWAQVQVGYDEDLDGVHEKLVHDMAYVAHLYRLSTYLRIESRILWRTVRVVLTGRGAR